MRSGRRSGLPTIAPAVLREAARSATPIAVFIVDHDRPPVAETVDVIVVETSIARIRRNGLEEDVDLDRIRDPAAIRRRVNGDNWFTRLLDKVSWL